MTGTLPNLLIAGVPKVGTSSLFRYLAQHPEICASSQKEIAYFNPLRSEGGTLPDLASYRRYFSHYKGQRYAMEATPSYCYGPARLREAIEVVLHRPRAVIILRDPVDRLWSAYTFQRSKGHLGSVATFEEYVSVCELKRRSGQEEGPYFGGVTIGYYGDYLPAWFQLFGSRMKVIFSDELSSNPGAVIQRICRWLDIEEDIATSFDYRIHNRTHAPRALAVSRAAYAAKNGGAAVLDRAPALKRGLRKAYTLVNSGQLEERLRPETRDQLEEMYRESNRAVATTLMEHGYRSLPRWLEKAMP